MIERIMSKFLGDGYRQAKIDAYKTQLKVEIPSLRTVSNIPEILLPNRFFDMYPEAIIEGKFHHFQVYGNFASDKDLEPLIDFDLDIPRYYSEFSGIYNPHTLLVFKYFDNPAIRGKGIATEFFHNLEHLSRALGYKHLVGLAHNPNTIGFWTNHLGWTPMTELSSHEAVRIYPLMRSYLNDLGFKSYKEQASMTTVCKL